MLDNCLCIKGLWNGVKIVVVKFETMIICKIQLLHKKEPNGKLVSTSLRFALPGITIHLIICYKNIYTPSTIGPWWDEPKGD